MLHIFRATNYMHQIAQHFCLLINTPT